MSLTCPGILRRHGKARDSGILYDIQGPNKVWPRSIEFQINEGCTGDFWMTDGAALNRNGHLWQYVNGKLANEGTDAFPASGKILFQSAGSEVYFRNMVLYPLK